MKKLIEKSVAFYGMGQPDVVTDFNIESQSERRRSNYRDLKTISGRKLSVNFEYSTNEESAKSAKEQPEGLNHKDEYLEKMNNFVKATTEEEDNAHVKPERTKKLPGTNSGKKLGKSNSGRLQLTIPKGLDNEGVKAFVLEQINNHLAS